MTLRRTDRAPSRPRRRALAALVLGVVSVAIALVGTEIALRIAGFSFRLYPEEIQFGWPDPEVMRTDFQPDPDLIWVPHDYEERLDTSDGASTIVLLGDSCTERSVYPDSLTAFVRAALPDWSGRVVNAAVAGWSSFQGRHQLTRDILPMAPGVIVVYFGWNDHWLGYGVEDKNIARVARAGGLRLDGLRLVQLVQKARVGVLRRREEQPLLRVSPDDYRSNLTAMVRAASSVGSRAVLTTAPTSIRPDAVPEYLLERHIDDLARVLPLHAQYNEIVREVAAREGAILCDLDADARKVPPGVLERVVFLDDRIHLTEPGSGFVARRLFRCLLENALLATLID